MAGFFTSLAVIGLYFFSFAAALTFFLWIQAKRQGISFDEYMVVLKAKSK